MMTPADRPRRWRRFLGRLVLSVLLLFGMLAALPWAVSTPPGKRLVLSAANRALAPARVEAGSIRVAWLKPVSVSRLVLRDGAGKALVSVRSATLDRPFWKLATDRPRKAKLTLHGVDLDLTRTAKGSVDVVDILASALGRTRDEKPDPKPMARGRTPDLTIDVKDGSLRLASPELPQPFTAHQLSLAVHVPASLEPSTWTLRLAEPMAGDPATLELTGQFDPNGAQANLAELVMTLTSKRWPWSTTHSGIAVRGRMDGTVEINRVGGLWDVAARTSLSAIQAEGSALRGDTLRLDRADLEGKVAQGGRGWELQQLDLKSAVATVRATGTADPHSPALGTTTRVDARLELAALARQLPHAFRLRDGLSLERGALAVEASVHRTAVSSGLAIEGRVSDLAGRQGARTVQVRDPGGFSIRVEHRDSELRVERLAVRTGFLDAQGAGNLTKGVTVSGTLDLQKLQAKFQELVDFEGITLSGRARLGADYRRTKEDEFVGRLAAEVQGLRIAGTGARPIAPRALRIDAGATGPIGEWGLPNGWTRGRLAAKTLELSGDLHVTSGAGDGVLRIDELRMAWQPRRKPATSAAPAAPAEPVRFVARGRFDHHAGTMSLEPMPDALPEPLTLTAKGLRITGLASGLIRCEGRFIGDLERADRIVAALTENEPVGIKGTANIGCAGAFARTGIAIEAAIEAPEATLPGAKSAKRRPMGPWSLAFKAGRSAGSDRVVFERLTVAAPYGSLHVSGHLADPAARRLADFRGTIEPRWEAIDALVRNAVDPGARVRAVPRAFRLRGPLAGGDVVEIMEGLNAELAVDRFEGSAFGVRIAPTSVVLRCTDGQLAIEPIETTINGGRALLLPEVVAGDKEAIVLRLAAGTFLQDAEINDEVSRRLLAYIAPVLDDATRVKGRLSVRVDGASVPIVGGNRVTQSSAAGEVRFENVVFSAGRLTKELIGLTGRPSGNVRLDQALELKVADGRVFQRGLAVPIGPQARIELDGSVGFDQTISLRARVAGVAANRARRNPPLDEVLEQLQIGVPIAGTLSKPTIDRSALRIGLRDAGRSLFKGGNRQKAVEFLKELVRPELEGAPAQNNR